MQTQRGFTIFFAMLTASLALSIGIAIFELTIRELDLSATATQSQFAIYAADSGAECALYWDSKYNTNQSAFATTSAYTPATEILCDTQVVSVVLASSDGDFATTVFSITFLPQPYCATVTVEKSVDVSGTVATSIISRGYNTCVLGGVVRLERALQVSY